MSNMKSIINTHKKKIINPPKENITRTCNGVRKHQCPFNEKCLTNMSYTKQVSRQTKKIRKFNSSKLIFFERNVFERSTGVLLENHWRTTYNRFASSAKRCIFEFFIDRIKLFMYLRNNRGPRMEPCGILYLIVFISNLWLLMVVNLVLSLSYSSVTKIAFHSQHIT